MMYITRYLKIKHKLLNYIRINYLFHSAQQTQTISWSNKQMRYHIILFLLYQLWFKTHIYFPSLIVETYRQQSNKCVPGECFKHAVSYKISVCHQIHNFHAILNCYTELLFLCRLNIYGLLSSAVAAESFTP